MTAATETAGAAAEAATEVVQKAAAPIAFLAILGVAALAVAALVKRFGQSLPLPSYVGAFAPDTDADEDQDDDDAPDPDTEQWQ